MEKDNIFVGRRRKRRKIFGEGKYIFLEEKKNGEGKYLVCGERRTEKERGEIVGQGRRKRPERKWKKCYGEEKAIVDSCTDGRSKDLSEVLKTEKEKEVNI